MATAVVEPAVADDQDTNVLTDAVALTASVRCSLDCEPLLDVDKDMLPEQ